MAASTFFCTGLKELLNKDLDMGSLKLMLVDDTFVPNPDIDVVDTGGDDTGDASHCEIAADGYTGGFEGAGRKSVALTIAADKANDRTTITIPEKTWAALGGDVNSDIGGVLLIEERTDDTDSRVILFLGVDGGSYTTTGTGLKFPETVIPIPVS